MSKNDEIWMKSLVQRLYKEYRHIVWSYRVQLRPVSFIIKDLSSSWALWDPWTRTITLSENLVKNYDWWIVVEVLKHEMAHQLVSEVYEREDHHGPYFHKACEALGVLSWARSSKVTCQGQEPPQCKASLNEEDERLSRRVKKLLALAESGNEHEATAAMEKVRDLYEKYHIESLRKDEILHYTSVVITHKKKRLESFHQTLGSLLVDYFFVDVVYSESYDTQAQTEFKSIEILGTEQNVEMAEYVYWFLFHNIKILWNDYKEKTKVSGTRARNSFLQGALKGFIHRLDDSKNRKKEELEKVLTRYDKSLLVIEDKKFKDFIAFRFPRLHSRRRSPSFFDAMSYEAGKKQGKTLILKQGIHERESKIGLLGGKL